MTNAIFAGQLTLAVRRITHRTRGHDHGPITRLTSPSDLGQIVKPFVFLDLFDVNRETVQAMANMPLHPHSGVATATVPVEGRFRYNDPADDVPRIQGFQLWLSLPADLENGEPVSRYIEAQDMKQAGPAHVIVGNHEGVHSPVPAPEGIDYLLVTLRPGERWTYQPPADHAVGWLALARGELDAGAPVGAGEMVVFEPGEIPVTLEASGQEDAVFVLGSAVPHPYPLHLGHYAVHTSAQALETGERRIAELGRKLKESGSRRTSSGTIPVFR